MNFATHRLIFNPHRGQFVPVAEITRSHGKGRRAGLNAKAANVTSSQGNLLATAGNNINLTAGEANVQVDEAHQHKSKGFLSKKTITTRDTLDQKNRKKQGTDHGFLQARGNPAGREKMAMWGSISENYRDTHKTVGVPCCSPRAALAHAPDEAPQGQGSWGGY